MYVYILYIAQGTQPDRPTCKNKSALKAHMSVTMNIENIILPEKQQMPKNLEKRIHCQQLIRDSDKIAHARYNK